MFYFLFWLGGSGSAIYHNCFCTMMLLRCAGFWAANTINPCPVEPSLWEKSLGALLGEVFAGCPVLPAWCSLGAANAVLGIVCGHRITQRCSKALCFWSSSPAEPAAAARPHSAPSPAPELLVQSSLLGLGSGPPGLVLGSCSGCRDAAASNGVRREATELGCSECGGEGSPYKPFPGWFWLQAGLRSHEASGDWGGSWLCRPTAPRRLFNYIVIWMRCIDRISFPKSFILCYAGLSKKKKAETKE